MTDLTDRLAALGVTLPEVDKWRDASRDTKRHMHGWAPIPIADAAIAAVVGELERAHKEAKELAMTLHGVKLPPNAAQVAAQRLRAEKAEAEAAKWERVARDIAERWRKSGHHEGVYFIADEFDDPDLVTYDNAARLLVDFVVASYEEVPDGG